MGSTEETLRVLVPPLQSVADLFQRCPGVDVVDGHLPDLEENAERLRRMLPELAASDFLDGAHSAVEESAQDVAILVESGVMALHQASAMYKVYHAHLNFLVQEYKQLLSMRVQF